MLSQVLISILKFLKKKDAIRLRKQTSTFLKIGHYCPTYTLYYLQYIVISLISIQQINIFFSCGQEINKKQQKQACDF